MFWLYLPGWFANSISGCIFKIVVLNVSLAIDSFFQIEYLVELQSKKYIMNILFQQRYLKNGNRL